MYKSKIKNCNAYYHPQSVLELFKVGSSPI